MRTNHDKQNSVLIVDDEKMIVSMLESCFLKEGYRCDTAFSAESALELIRLNPYDVMISDIRLPGMNGLELTRQAKEIVPDMIVILMTGFADQFYYDKALEVGAADFIKKPFTPKEVTARTKQARMHKEISEATMIDGLTGLYNRQGFFKLSGHILQLEKREHRGLYLLCAVLDNLRDINTALGHSTGDEALKEMAHALKASYRESDVIARVGACEFAVVPVRGEESSSGMIVGRLQDEIAGLNADEKRKYLLSVSTGLAFIEAASPRSIEELLIEADIAMNEQKKLKRLK